MFSFRVITVTHVRSCWTRRCFVCFGHANIDALDNPALLQPSPHNWSAALLAAAAQYMPPAAASSSSTPGSTLGLLGGGARNSSAARMKQQQAAPTADAVAKVIPMSSPDTKVLEKRVLENTAELTETRVKMPPAAASSSSTPGSTLGLLGGGAWNSSAARMKQQAAPTADAVAKVIPMSSPDTKVLEKRVLENTAELTETRLKIAKVDELAVLKKNLEAKELEVAAKGNSATFLEKARLAHMRNKVVDMEDKIWGFDSALAEEAE